MNFLALIFNEVFYRPLLNALVWLTGFLPGHDFGLAVIILTLTVRLALSPLMHKSIKTQRKMKEIEPELKKIKDGVKDREEQARRTMDLYKQHGINPFSGVLLLFIQLPILIALYLVFRESPADNIEYLYDFVSMPGSMDTIFLGFFDLAGRSFILAFLAGLTQFVQIKLAQLPAFSGTEEKKGGKPDFMKMFSSQMTYFMPVLIFFIASRFPSAVALYWTTINIFAIVHEGFVRNKAKKSYAAGNNRENSNADTKPS